MRLRYSKLTGKQTARLCEHFVAGTPASTAVALVGVNKNTAALFYRRLCEIVAARIEDEYPIRGKIDESYFGGARKGKRGRGAAGKVPVFGILKRRGQVYTKMIPDARAVTLMPIRKAFVAGSGRHINGIENFWNQAKRHLRKYNESRAGTETSAKSICR